MTDFATRREQLVQAHLRPPGERPPTTAGGIHHMAMICSDVEATIRFYQDLLGFPLVGLQENRDYPGSTHFFFDLGGGDLLGFFDFPGLGLGPAAETLGSLQHVAIAVTPERLAELRRRLDEAGVEYLGPDRGLSRSVYFKDPDGIQVELLAAPRYDPSVGTVDAGE